ncbi:hypothetical protein ACS0TY_035097 [Phlomoides rotata]
MRSCPNSQTSSIQLAEATQEDNIGERRQRREGNTSGGDVRSAAVHDTYTFPSLYLLRINRFFSHLYYTFSRFDFFCWIDVCGESVTIEGQAYMILAVTHRYQFRKGKYEPSEKRLDVLSSGRYILNLYLESLLEQS